MLTFPRYAQPTCWHIIFEIIFFTLGPPGIGLESCWLWTLWTPSEKNIAGLMFFLLITGLFFAMPRLWPIAKGGRD
jgi:hypothetical protein